MFCMSHLVFVVPPPLAVRGSPQSKLNMPILQFRQNFRPLSSQKKDDESDWEAFKKAGGNLVKRGADKVRSYLPFLKSKDEKRSDIIKKERKGEITGGINEMLKDMPLPVRILGRIVSPLLAKAAEQMAEQSRQAQDVLEEARMRLAEFEHDLDKRSDHRDGASELSGGGPAGGRDRHLGVEQRGDTVVDHECKWEQYIRGLSTDGGRGGCVRRQVIIE